MATYNYDKHTLKTNRIETLIDGVFAIVMTLLIFSFKVPIIVSENVNKELLNDMLHLWPAFLTYFISFVILGVYWVGLHNIFTYVRYADRIFLWINIFFLAFVALIPFSTQILAHYSNAQIAHIFYGLNLILIGVILYINWHYASLHHRLVDHSVNYILVKNMKIRILFAPFVSVLAILLSFINTKLSWILYLTIPIYYFLPGKMDYQWKRPAIPHNH